MTELPEIRADLAAEHDELDGIVADLEPSDWDRPTPAEGWSVRDQISHLAFFDEQARVAVEDPDGFAAGLQRAAVDVGGFMNQHLERGRSLDPAGLIGWWREARSNMLQAFRDLDGARRIAWFGPPMSASSFVSARIMETWAHGQDIVDALGIDRDATERLRHVAFLGVRARPFSFVANGRQVPEGDVRVELEFPSGKRWEMGASEVDRVIGSALGFCLVVTQRRHLDDSDVVAEGPLASEWMSIAQCFAGPPGSGRQPGQFVKS